MNQLKFRRMHDCVGCVKRLIARINRANARRSNKRIFISFFLSFFQMSDRKKAPEPVVVYPADAPPGGVIDVELNNTRMPMFDYGEYHAVDHILDGKGYHKLHLRSTEYDAPEFVSKHGTYDKYTFTVRHHDVKEDDNFGGYVNNQIDKDATFHACMFIDVCAARLVTHDPEHAVIITRKESVVMKFRKVDYKAPDRLHPFDKMSLNIIKTAIRNVDCFPLGESPEKLYSSDIVKRARDAVLSIMKLDPLGVALDEQIYRKPKQT